MSTHDLVELHALHSDIHDRLGDKARHPLAKAQEALKTFPADGELLILAAFAAVVEQRPDLALAFIKRYHKNYFADSGSLTCECLALAQAGQWYKSQQLMTSSGINLSRMCAALPPGIAAAWARQWYYDILRWSPPRPAEKSSRKMRHPDPSNSISTGKSARVVRAPTAQLPLARPDFLPELPRIPAAISIAWRLPGIAEYELLQRQPETSGGYWRARADFFGLHLLNEVDNLLCLSDLRGVDYYFYQVETVKKVLKQFHGRVLLADEVGLGKTIEAGMTIKEYLLRGMASSVLIFTPPALVGQWREEMERKFGLDFVTTNDRLFADDAVAFWASPRIIASLALARRPRHFEAISGLEKDIVVVDEAHHLKNRTTRNWQLIDALKKRFLLLLSATPVQNNLLELYNLLTLLKPGIFKTEKEFRVTYMTPGKPRTPANRETLQNLMRDVMIRNTRALVDVKLPPRHAVTVNVDPMEEEAACYRELDRLIGVEHRLAPGGSRHRLSLHHLLAAAGSSPAAVATVIGNYLDDADRPDWRRLHERYESLKTSAKIERLVALLRQNPDEKKMVFVQYRATVDFLHDRLISESLACARFDGAMSGPEKDRAIEEFRHTVPILLCTETGGEGRNVQFCNTIVNFDLPWNPQIIEQRTGRIHRIGQTRDVYLFNLVTRGTIEDQLLRVLDEKINMFTLVVGEIQTILGELEEQESFADMVFNAWVATTQETRTHSFDALGDRLLEAKAEYAVAQELDNELFGEGFEVI